MKHIKFLIIFLALWNTSFADDKSVESQICTDDQIAVEENCVSYKDFFRPKIKAVIKNLKQQQDYTTEKQQTDIVFAKSGAQWGSVITELPQIYKLSKERDNFHKMDLTKKLDLRERTTVYARTINLFFNRFVSCKVYSYGNGTWGQEDSLQKEEKLGEYCVYLRKGLQYDLSEWRVAKDYLNEEQAMPMGVKTLLTDILKSFSYEGEFYHHIVNARIWLTNDKNFDALYHTLTTEDKQKHRFMRSQAPDQTMNIILQVMERLRSYTAIPPKPEKLN